MKQSEGRKASKRRYANSLKGRLQNNNWRNTTIRGCLHRKYRDITRRCGSSEDEKHKSYKRRDIKNKFKSASDFTNYVINVLKIDPRGLNVHRIDNDRHYEPGNIEFLTGKEHRQKHIKLRAKIKCEKKLC